MKPNSVSTSIALRFAFAAIASHSLAFAAHSEDLSPTPTVATPKSILGFTPGDDNKLNSWADLTRYYEALAKTSDRVKVQTLGKTTEGRPYLVAVFSSAENIRNLKRYQDQNAKISDPRKLTKGDVEAESLIKSGKVVVVVTCGIHSSEVASYLSGQNIAYRLAAANDEQTKRILDNTIVVLVPALNPDGVDIVKGQFDQTLATGSTQRRVGGLPQPLYHKYVGHDDNRDWVGFTQVETQISVEKVINPWHPQVLQDIHQQGANGPRITLPPYTDPVEPNIPKQLVKGYTDLGHGIAADLLAQGFTGVLTGGASAAGYDAWSPLRQYAHFHNAVRMLQETASARIAAPATIDADQVRPSSPLPNYPKPWPGGTWRVGDATNLATAAAFSLLDRVASNRETWLRTAYEIAKEAVRARGKGETAAWLLPDSPRRGPLLTILQTGGVEVQTLISPLKVAGVEYPKGTAVVRLDQPFGGFANAVLSVQHYPNLRDESGRPVRPYDVTAHTLPLLLDTPAIAVEGPFEAKTRLERKGRRNEVRVANSKPVDKVRLAVLKSNTIDEGWTRWVLEKNNVAYNLVDPTGLARPEEIAKYDAVLLPTPLAGNRGGGGGGGSDVNIAVPEVFASIQAAPAGAQTGREALIKNVKAYVENGGTVIALNRASNSVIGALSLPIKDVTQGLARNDFYAPGSLLQADLDAAHPIAKGLSPSTSLWVESSPAFELTETNPSVKVDVIASYPRGKDPLLSGWLLGGDKLQGKAALVEAHVGKGRAILFAFEPNYRGISLGTYPLLFNAINRARP